MPRQILPHLESFSQQMHGILSYYRRILDDEFFFGAGIQVPQVATIFDRVADTPLSFTGEVLSLTELLTLIAYRYGLEGLQVVGHGGYAIVIGHRDGDREKLMASQEPRRVVRFVPEHHVRAIIAQSDDAPEYDVRLDDHREPVRDADYPLLISDLFLMPRHTTKLVFKHSDDQIVQSGGYPANLHCQLLPEVHPFNKPGLDQRMAKDAGDLLEAALATLGVSVADAHGGNGGVLIGVDGMPILHHATLSSGQTKTFYVPIVLDYGYYARIGPRTLADVMVRHGVTYDMVEACLAEHHISIPVSYYEPWQKCLATIIDQSGLPRYTFGRLLYQAMPATLDPYIWIARAEHQWQTAKEKIYPPLKTQSRLSHLYPEYDEVLFPQRIEEYAFII